MYGMEGLIEGQMVHYILTESDVKRIEEQRRGEPLSEKKDITKPSPFVGNSASAGEHVPMVIVKVWPDEFGPGRPGVNGQVWLDGNDSLWVTSAQYDAEKSPGSWHWIEKA